MVWYGMVWYISVFDGGGDGGGLGSLLLVDYISLRLGEE